MAIEAFNEPPRWPRDDDRLERRDPLGRKDHVVVGPDHQAILLDRAVNRLVRLAPHHSAHVPFWTRQIVVLGLWAGLVSAGFVAVPSLAWPIIFLVLALPFACIAAFRTFAIVRLFFSLNHDRSSIERVPDSALPTYSILVPLYDEAHMIPQIVAALDILDYPRERMELLIIVEASDQATQEACRAASLPEPFHVVVVPDAAPRTKPKALNYALGLARGDCVVVYDAEDLPAPGQLRAAAQLFAQTPANVACLQARLRIHNAKDSWLTRHFSLEYLALFDGLLPAYQALGVPLPLGGTSNHFPRRVLEDIGGWDPYNVTEDADLGIRLTRLGYKARMLASDTGEEAPATFAGWLPQRTRWLKGWMQTWLVHARQPLRTLREMGPICFIGFHMIFGGLVLAALVHPFMYALFIWQFATIGPFAVPVDGAGLLITSMTAFNLALGYLSAMVLCVATAVRRRQAGLMFHVLTLPVYWLLVSAAAWRALWQLIDSPFRWEKTRHTRSF